MSEYKDQTKRVMAETLTKFKKYDRHGNYVSLQGPYYGADGPLDQHPMYLLKIAWRVPWWIERFIEREIER